MKSKTRKIALLLMNLLAVLALLCSCGSELDGTWTSRADKKTKIKFSGDKVKVSYGSFKLNGTYEEDEEDNSVIILNLTDDDGNLYRITAVIALEEDTLTMTNSRGSTEVFER